MKDSVRNFQGWLLFAPAAILLLAFTHYPTVTTFIHSLYTNKSFIRPKRFSGIESYESMFSDPIFFKVFVNNMWLALGTIPTSIATVICNIQICLRLNHCLNSTIKRQSPIVQNIN